MTELVILSGSDEDGDPMELIAPKGTMVPVLICRTCRTRIRYGKCPKCEA